MFITLYAELECPYSHQVRLLLAEKKIDYKLIELSYAQDEAKIMKISPSGTLPVLQERDNIFYDAKIIMHYIDERYPSPPLMPSYPVMRAKTRLALSRIEKDWYSMMREIESNSKYANESREALSDSFKAIAPIFADSEFFMSDTMTLADCTLSVLLWRLPLLGIKLTDDFKEVKTYADRMFARESFQDSIPQRLKNLLLACQD